MAAEAIALVIATFIPIAMLGIHVCHGRSGDDLALSGAGRRGEL